MFQPNRTVRNSTSRKKSPDPRYTRTDIIILTWYYARGLVAFRRQEKGPALRSRSIGSRTLPERDFVPAVLLLLLLLAARFWNLVGCSSKPEQIRVTTNCLYRVLLQVVHRKVVLKYDYINLLAELIELVPQFEKQSAVCAECYHDRRATSYYYILATRKRVMDQTVSVQFWKTKNRSVHRTAPYNYDISKVEGTEPIFEIMITVVEPALNRTG